METNSRRHSVDNSSMQMNGQTFESGMQESYKHNLGASSSYACPNGKA